jgi:hypothetical protein
VRNPRLVNLITLADVLSREQHLGFSGNFAFTLPRQPLVDAIGLPDGAVERVLQKLVQAIEPRASALGLGTAGTGELYQQALSQANRELGRMSGVGRSVRHARARGKHADRDGQPVRRVSGVEGRQMGDPSCALSDGVLHEVDGRPHR